MKKSCLTVIPARLGSERFPEKVLKNLRSKPVLQWCWETAVKANLGEVIIAADDKKVMDFAYSIGAKAVLTSKNLKSGTDRVYHAAKNTKSEYVLNFQGDEPFMDPRLLKKTYREFIKNPSFDMATAASPIKNIKEIENPDCVKAVVGFNNAALYFSRSPIPFHHKLSPLNKNFPYYKHIGFYFYKRKALEKFVKLKPSPLEKLERLEQLRALENGMSIFINTKTNHNAPSIDTPADLREAERYAKYLKRG